MEHERRVRKRLARLSEAAEDSFSHIKRQLRSDSNMPGAQSSLDPIETAHAVFPAMARSMQKYLRTTRYVKFHMYKAYNICCILHTVRNIRLNWNRHLHVDYRLDSSNTKLRRKLILKIEIRIADWRRLESLAPIGRAKENLASK